jgi:hypothetical protein
MVTRLATLPRLCPFPPRSRHPASGRSAPAGLHPACCTQPAAPRLRSPGPGTQPQHPGTRTQHPGPAPSPRSPLPVSRSCRLLLLCLTLLVLLMLQIVLDSADGDGVCGNPMPECDVR